MPTKTNGQEENAVTDTFCVDNKYKELTTCVLRTMEEAVPAREEENETKREDCIAKNKGII